MRVGSPSIQSCVAGVSSALGGCVMSRSTLQVNQLHHSLQCSQQQSASLRAELQRRCEQVEQLSQDHNALLAKFKELTLLMSEAHNKLNSAVAQTGKAIATHQTKVQQRTTLSSVCLTVCLSVSPAWCLLVHTCKPWP